MAEGAANLRQDSNYLDLPAYQAVRMPRPRQWAEDDKKNLLILCSFGEEYSGFYAGTLGDIIYGRTRNKTLLRMMGLFNSMMRELVEMSYLHTTPVVLDDSAIQKLLGPVKKTSYDEGIRTTLDAMRGTAVSRAA